MVQVDHHLKETVLYPGPVNSTSTVSLKLLPSHFVIIQGGKVNLISLLLMTSLSVSRLLREKNMEGSV